MRLVLVAFAASSMLGGCTAMGGDPPKRPPVAVADEVQQVAASKIVGTWTCRELNPYPEVLRQVSTITYAKDGAFTAKAQYDDTTPPFGDMTVETTGRWMVQGERIVISEVKTSAGLPGCLHEHDGQPCFFARQHGVRSEQGSGEPLKLTQTELEFRAEGRG